MIGIDTDAPFLDTAIADATDAIFKDFSTVFPIAVCAKKYPVNVSPAAVVSMALTLNGGWKTTFSVSLYILPSLPRVIMILSFG